jgi:N-acetylglucosaminyldiphosphoundecaprenol N-acetyl-beta-D-mannosaminyltransferase
MIPQLKSIKPRPVRPVRKVRIISLNVDVISLEDSILEVMDWGMSYTPSYVCFANVHMLVEAHRNLTFRRQVNNASMVLADGTPIVKSCYWMYGKTQERKAGMDFMPVILKAANESRASVFLYGSSEKVLEKMVDRIRQEYPLINICGQISPPFREMTAHEQDAHIRQINFSGANLVLVSLGCPKQEKWMADHSKRINAVLLGLGGAFSVFAGIRKRAPGWMQNSGLEWLYRLFQEPGRMFKRYLYTNTYFIFLLARKMLNR